MIDLHILSMECLVMPPSLITDLIKIVNKVAVGKDD